MRAAATVVALVPLAAANGGYFPTAWGWATLGFAWAAILALVLVQRAAVGRQLLLFFAAVCALSAWTWLSAIWSRDLPATILEGERSLVYVAAVGAAAVAFRGRGAALLAGALTASALVSVYALGTRLFPGRIQTPYFGGYRLSTPIGYWNSLGLFAAIGVLLALGFATRSRNPFARAAAAAATVPLVATLYFTFSRGAWLALIVALVYLVALDSRRLQLVAVGGLVGIPPAVGVLLASRSQALTTQGAPVERVASEGHRLAVELLVLAAAAAAVAAVADRAGPVPRPVRLGFASLLAAAALAGVGAAWATWGSPPTLAQRAWHAFVTPPVASSPNLNSRLFQFSGTNRILAWHAALHEFDTSPALGTGAGTFETWWDAHRPVDSQVRDAHSLYLETLAELGVVGAVLLALLLAVPLAAGWRARTSPLGAFAAAAFVAWGVHVAVDWDWEIPAVTLLAFACAAASMSDDEAGREHALRRTPLVVAAAVAVSVAGLVALVGNQALAASQSALDHGNYANAALEARRASRWAPWSAEPWLIRGQIEALAGDAASARASFRTAIRKEPRSYLAWYGLAGVESGATRRAAAAEVVRLNPFSAEARELRKVLNGSSGSSGNGSP